MMHNGPMLLFPRMANEGCESEFGNIALHLHVRVCPHGHCISKSQAFATSLHIELTAHLKNISSCLALFFLLIF